MSGPLRCPSLTQFMIFLFLNLCDGLRLRMQKSNSKRHELSFLVWFLPVLINHQDGISVVKMTKIFYPLIRGHKDDPKIRDSARLLGESFCQRKFKIMIYLGKIFYKNREIVGMWMVGGWMRRDIELKLVILISLSTDFNAQQMLFTVTKIVNIVTNCDTQLLLILV